MPERTAPQPGATPELREMLARQVPYWRTVYRRTWKGSAVLSFVEPWLYLLSMGVLLGGYVDAANSSTGGASSYLDFIAPGLLAATAMQLSSDEAMWPVMGRIKWDKTYLGMVATPLRIVDIVTAHACYVTLRVTFASAVFTVVLAFFGVFGSVPGALIAWLGAILVGVAFFTSVYGYTAGAMDEQGFAVLYRVAVVPMFLFSGAFFPVSNMPIGLEWLARVTPLYHGVELCRMASLGAWTSAAWVHLAYLLVMAVLGFWWSVRRLTRRLVV